MKDEEKEGGVEERKGRVVEEGRRKGGGSGKEKKGGDGGNCRKVGKRRWRNGGRKREMREENRVGNDGKRKGMFYSSKTHLDQTE